jgi:hypothetical protein
MNAPNPLYAVPDLPDNQEVAIAVFQTELRFQSQILTKMEVQLTAMQATLPALVALEPRLTKMELTHKEDKAEIWQAVEALKKEDERQRANEMRMIGVLSVVCFLLTFFSNFLVSKLTGGAP